MIVKTRKNASPSTRPSFGLELRSFEVFGIETRADGGHPRLRGRAAVFNSLSQPITVFGLTFRERIAPGAFADSIVSGDIRALWNHDTGHVLGRTTAGTLTLKEDERGLAVDIKPPNTTWARDLIVSIERGDVSQMSFGFQVPVGGDTWDIENGEDVRTLRRISLLEVSPVTFPAYTATDIGARTIAGCESRDLFGAYSRLEAGNASHADRELLRRAANRLAEQAGPTQEELDEIALFERINKLRAA